jgi:hypothetical protein
MDTGSENQAEPLCTYCEGDEAEQCDKCGDYFTSCEVCGELNIPVDFDGMAGDICDTCGTPPAVEVVQALSVLCVDADRFTEYEIDIFTQAVLLLRTHALPESHPWAVE